ncbi:MAG: NAD(P)/FAD-dependent oxidoreductase [Oscillospiraceae bacterium]|nr:NAD(P)/FAD-dependent oxidoreductase [Oscillospiraceae bacterium]
MNYDVIVIGGGPAGMAAALQAQENGATRVLILERDTFLGGILMQCIHTGFGLHYFKEELSGPEFAHRFIEKIEANPAIEVKLDTMVLDIQSGEPHSIIAVNKADGLMQLSAKSIVLAMGCRERPRGALNIAGARPAGVLSAGTAQKYVNMDGYLPGREVVILGSGDIGLIMARRMTFEGAKVKMVCELMPYSGGLTRNIVQCLNDFDIPLKLSTTVVDIHGGDRVTGVTIAQVDDNRRPIPGTEEHVPCDLLLLSVGLIPENELSRAAGLAIDPITGGALVNEACETEIPGIYACGNVLHVHDLVDYVALEAEVAGAAAAQFAMRNSQCATGDYVATRGENGVRYVVPQRVNKQADAPITLYFRVGQVYANASVQVRAGDKILAKERRARITPGEMEHLMVKPEQLADCNELVVEVVA